MSINYEKVGWNPSIYFGPTNMNHMDDGIKAACDGVDELGEKVGATDISKIGDGSITGAVAQNAKNIEAVNSNLIPTDVTADALSNPYPDNITLLSGTRVELVTPHLVHVHLDAMATTPVKVNGMGNSTRWGQLKSGYLPSDIAYGITRYNDADGSNTAWGVIGVTDRGYVCVPAGTASAASRVTGDVWYTI